VANFESDDTDQKRSYCARQTSTACATKILALKSHNTTAVSSTMTPILAPSPRCNTPQAIATDLFQDDFIAFREWFRRAIAKVLCL
jgi:hypothetical protein